MQRTLGMNKLQCFSSWSARGTIPEAPGQRRNFAQLPQQPGAAYALDGVDQLRAEVIHEFFNNQKHHPSLANLNYKAIHRQNIRAESRL